MQSRIKCSAFNGELLAIYLSIKYFKRLVEGRLQPLQTFNKDRELKTGTTNETFAVHFEIYIQYLRGNTNILADILSGAFEVNVLYSNDLNIKILQEE